MMWNLTETIEVPENWEARFVALTEMCGLSSGGRKDGEAHSPYYWGVTAKHGGGPPVAMVLVASEPERWERPYSLHFGYFIGDEEAAVVVGDDPIHKCLGRINAAASRSSEAPSGLDRTYEFEFWSWTMHFQLKIRNPDSGGMAMWEHALFLTARLALARAGNGQDVRGEFANWLQRWDEAVEWPPPPAPPAVAVPREPKQRRVVRGGRRREK